MDFFVLSRRLLPLAASLLLAGCAGLASSPVPLGDYQLETFNADTFVRHYVAPPVRTCEAARRALLSQGYIVTDATADKVIARKYFQPRAEHHVQLEFRVVCARESGDGDATVAFASGLKEQYVVRKVKESASLGVGGIGSLSLPVEGSLDSMVKVSSETVDDATLYQRFFELLGQYLDRSVAPEAVPAAAS